MILHFNLFQMKNLRVCLNYIICYVKKAIVQSYRLLLYKVNQIESISMIYKKYIFLDVYIIICTNLFDLSDFVQIILYYQMFTCKMFG